MRRLAAIAILTCLAIVAVASLGPGDASRPDMSVHVRTAAGVAPPLAPEQAAAVVDGYHAAAYLSALDDEHSYLAVVGYLTALARPSPQLPQAGVETASPPPRTVGGVSHSLTWWNALSRCESGGTNGWRTGWFGIEAGYPIGGLSYGEQLAWAQRIMAQYGETAWGCSPVADAAVPGG